MSEVSSPGSPSTIASTPQSRGYQGERLLDEQGWREESKGVIKEIINFVKVFAISDQLNASSTEIFLNLVTLEDSAFTIKLNERGFEVVGNSLDTNNTEGDRVYETPHSLLDNISPGYRQAWGASLSQQLALVAKERGQD
jgi:hypothetical protein